MGSLTSPLVLNLGSTPGEASGPSIAAINAELFGANVAANWTPVGAGILAYTDPWENGFNPGAFTSNLATDYAFGSTCAVNTTVSVPARPTDRINCLSCYIKTFPPAPTASQCRLEFRLTAGAILSIDVDPRTGVLIAKTPGVLNPQVQRLVLPLYLGVENVSVYRISFAFNGGGIATGTPRFYPHIAGQPAATTIFGGVQLEYSVTTPSPFITPNVAVIGQRIGGQAPRQTATPNLQQKVLGAGLIPYAVDPWADQDTWLQCNLLAGNTINLPQAPSASLDMPTGSRLLVTQSATAVGGVTTITGAVNSIIAPGGIVSPNTTITFPSVNYPNVTQMLLVKTDVLNQWQIVSTSAGGSAGGLFLQAGAGAIARTFQNKDRDIVSVKDFGAIGDGLVDDTVAIQNALNSGATTILFPRPPNTYKITAELTIGFWSWAGPGANVLGFAGPTPSGITLVGEGTPGRAGNPSTITWFGADQPGTTVVVENDTVGPWNHVTDCAAMIHVVGRVTVTLRNMSLWGSLDLVNPAAGNRAMACLWIEGFVTQYHLENVKLAGARIGFRNGTRIMQQDAYVGTAYYGLGGSPWYMANVFNYVAVGGYQGDTQTIETSYLGGTICGYSSESAQNLQLHFAGSQIYGGMCGVMIDGGWISLNSTGFGPTETGSPPTVADIWNNANSMVLSCKDVHSESVATWNVLTATTGAPQVTIIGGDFGKVKIAGGGASLSIRDTANTTIQRLDVNAASKIIVENTSITGLSIANTGVRSNVIIDLINCPLTNAILQTTVTESNCYLQAHNCLPFSNLPPYAGSLSTFRDIFNGQSHTIKGTVAAIVSGAAAQIITSILTDGFATSGYCNFRIFWSTATNSATIASCVGSYQFCWTVDTGGNVTVSAVSVINEAKALDGYATFVPVITAAVNGTDLLILVAQTNTAAASNADAYLIGEVIHLKPVNMLVSSSIVAQ